MPTTPPASPIDITSDSSFLASKQVLQTRYNDVMAWAAWSAGILESKLADINKASESFNIDTFITNATAAITAIPNITPGTITYTAPTAPAYTSIPSYVAPTDPTYDTVPTYTAPTAPTYDDVTYTAPTFSGTLLSVPTPTQYTAGTAPTTDLTWTDADFSNSLLTSLETKLSGDITTPSTGLGNAEAALFARETARQNSARSAAYNEVTTQFSARGFDLPPGALLAKQTEINNESNIRLSDSSSQIMAESARLAQSWNQTTITASAQLSDLLSRVFDSKQMRGFEAAKQSVILKVEEFKAAIAVVSANASLESTYIGSIASTNDGLIKRYTAEISGASASVSAKAESNKSKSESFSALVQGAIAPITAVSESNKSKSSAFSAAVQGAVAPITSIAEANRSLASGYSASVQGAAADVQAQGEREKAAATAGDINSRKALGIADITSKFSLAQMETAARTFLGEIQVLQSSAQAASQMVASAIGSVSVSSSFGWSAGASDTHTTSVSQAAEYPQTVGTPPPFTMTQ